VTVAAVFHGDYGLPDPPPEPYSSCGPTTDERLKPDLMAPDGTSSFTYGPNGSFGTSFAAPVVAGAAALLLQDLPGLSPEDLALALFDNTIDVGPPGPDPISGQGTLYLPEPPNWLMMVCGTGFLGVLYRWRTWRSVRRAGLLSIANRERGAGPTSGLPGAGYEASGGSRVKPGLRFSRNAAIASRFAGPRARRPYGSTSRGI
jgi:hypothetical protein